jgi:hypothetical protein
MRRAQLTVEFLLILAIMLVVLGAFIYLSQTSESGVLQTKTKNQAERTLEDLSAAAKEVYTQGKGASKQVYITIPEGFEPKESFIANKSIKIRVSGNDFLETERFDLHGTLPASAGNHWVWVISEGNSVRIGYAMMEISRSSIILSMEPGQSRSIGLSLKNIWPSQINVSLSKDMDSEIDLMISPIEAEIDSGLPKSIALTFSSQNGTVGVFTGSLQIESTDGSIVEYITVPITVIVSGGSTFSEEKKLFVVPTSLNLSMQLNTSVSKSIKVCTDESTEVDSVQLIPSTGAPGVWVGGASTIPAIPKDSCKEVVLNISTPANANLGKYSGFVEFRSAIHSEKLDIQIDVGGIPYDLDGPVVSNHSIVGKAYANIPLTFLTDVEDNKSSISECRIRVDSGSWNEMHAVDGSMDERKEKVFFRYMDGFSAGEHTVSTQCLDTLGNLGVEKTENFTLLKEMMFLTFNSTMSRSEQEWSDWIKLHKSNEGFSWNYEVWEVNNIQKKDFDDYAIVVMVDYNDMAGLSDNLDHHINEGGTVVLLGEANQEGPFFLCSTNEIGNPFPTKTIDIFISDHYITRNYSRGPLNIFTIDSKIYSMPTDYVGDYLGMSSISEGFPVLGYSNSTVNWGVYRPFRMNQDGITLTKRALDFALLESTK